MGFLGLWVFGSLGLWFRRSGISRTDLFRRFAGQREFNPIALVFTRFALVERFRFWRPFREARHGKEESLRRIEASLFERLERNTAVNWNLCRPTPAAHGPREGSNPPGGAYQEPEDQARHREARDRS
jgi:hypothetical protein